MLHNTMVSIIAAMDQKRGIGKGGTIPWHISKDFKRFKQITLGHPVIMGRKTFESLNRPHGLPGRTNIVVTRDPQFKPEGIVVVDSLETAITSAHGVILSGAKDLKNEGGDSSAVPQNDTNEMFIIGGGQIFKEAIEKGLVDKLYLTIIKGDFACDTFFPDYAAFTKEVSRQEGESEGYEYTFLDLER